MYLDGYWEYKMTNDKLSGGDIKLTNIGKIEGEKLILD